MIITKWFREWRQFVAEQKIRQEDQLEKEVNDLMNFPSCYSARDIIGHVRFHDRYNG